MIRIVRTDSNNKDFTALVKLLDADLAIRDGEDHTFYAQFNKIDTIKHVIVTYTNDIPISCGAIKEYDKNSMEIKRMFTSIDHRGSGIASIVLAELEKWTKELSFNRCILETGLKQPEAIRLYEKNGYNIIPNYGQYEAIENSRCFEKMV